MRAAFFFLALFVIAETQYEERKCLSDFAYVAERRTCYRQGFRKIALEKRSWPRAMRICRTYGGQLAAVHSADENDFIQGHVIRNASEVDQFWIGASSPHKKRDKFKWTDGGGALNYTDWIVIHHKFGVPLYCVEKEHAWCAAVRLSQNLRHTWRTTSCAKELPFVCTAKPT